MVKTFVTLKSIILSLLLLSTMSALNISSTHEIDHYQDVHLEEEIEMSYVNNTVRRLTPSQAYAKMAENPNAIILDVRTQEEFDAERIPGAILLPDYDVSAHAAYVLPNKDALILIYCRSGRRSLNTAYLLVSMGYTNVYDFGGIIDWPYESE